MMFSVIRFYLNKRPTWQVFLHIMKDCLRMFHCWYYCFVQLATLDSQTMGSSFVCTAISVMFLFTKQPPISGQRARSWVLNVMQRLSLSEKRLFSFICCRGFTGIIRFKFCLIPDVFSNLHSVRWGCLMYIKNY